MNPIPSSEGPGRAGDDERPARGRAPLDWLHALGLASLLGAIGALALLAGSLIRALLVLP